MSLTELIIVGILFVFLIKKEDLQKIKKIINHQKKHIKKAQSYIDGFFDFLHQQNNVLPTSRKKSKKNIISYVEKDFITKTINPIDILMNKRTKKTKKNLSTKPTKPTK